eukprot:537652-Rhodomonas_salina.1
MEAHGKVPEYADIELSASEMMIDERGMTPLHVAMAGTRASVEIVEALLEAFPAWASCRVASANGNGQSEGFLPLHFALQGRAPTDKDCAAVEGLIRAYPEAAASEEALDFFSLELALSTGFPVSTLRALLMSCRGRSHAPRELQLLFQCHPDDRPAGWVWLLEAPLLPAFLTVVDEEGYSVLGTLFDDAERRQDVIEALVTDANASIAKDKVHWYSWTKLVSRDQDVAILTAVLESEAADVWRLVFEARDEKGRRAIDIATPACRQALKRQVLFCGRYSFVQHSPNY